MFDKTAARALAAALALLALLPAAQAACKYKRLGSIPLEWRGTAPILHGTINGTPVDVLVDTGAAHNTISATLADKLHLALGHTDAGTFGVGGTSALYRTRIDQLTLGKFEWDRVPMRVLDKQAKDDLDVIIGADFLFQHDVEMTRDALTFYEPSDCADASLAYWSPDASVLETTHPADDDKHVHVTVSVNGRPVTAMVDSGASHSLLDLPAARAIGFDPAHYQGPVGTVGGIGAHDVSEWLYRLDTLTIAGHDYRHVPMHVADLWGNLAQDTHVADADASNKGRPHMMLGGEFLKARHVLFAESQHRLYFTFTNGTDHDMSMDAVVRAAAAQAPAASR